MSSLAVIDDVMNCVDNEKHRSQRSVNNAVVETVFVNVTALDTLLLVDFIAEDTVCEEKSDAGVASLERLPETCISVSIGTAEVRTTVFVVISVVVTVLVDMDSEACTVSAGITVEYTVLVDISVVDAIVEDRALSLTSAQETDFVTSEDIVFVVTDGIQISPEAVVLVISVVVTVLVDMDSEARTLLHTSAQETDTFVPSEDTVFVVTDGIQVAPEAVVLFDDCNDPVV